MIFVFTDEYFVREENALVETASSLSVPVKYSFKPSWLNVSVVHRVDISV